jgi:MarR family transcriptional regulator, transcriptional regulator for hemolysin
MSYDGSFPGRPIGLEVAATAKALNRAFNAALARAGGTQAIWLILLSLKQQPRRSQLELAGAVGIGNPTLTRHLDGLERAGLITRLRDPSDRRNSHVELTDAGDELFYRLRNTAVTFDRRLRKGFSQDELDQLTRWLARLVDNTRDAAGARAGTCLK